MLAKKFPQPVYVKFSSKYHVLNTDYTVDSEKKLECNTRKQADCKQWREARISRKTSSNFRTVLKQKAPPTAACILYSIIKRSKLHLWTMEKV